MTKRGFVSLPGYVEHSPAEMQQRAESFYQEAKVRRSVRHFSDRPIPDGVIENSLRAAGTAPSGANLQPWHFVVIRDPDVKKRIRIAAEQEEREFYERRAPDEWLAVLDPLGTDAEKPFLERAPVLIAIFARYFEEQQGQRKKTYYPVESVGIATGVLITALHHAGLTTLTHTPSPMGFLGAILERPSTERPFLLLVAGYPEKDAKVPDIVRKSLPEIATFLG